MVHCINLSKVDSAIGLLAMLVVYFQLATSDANKLNSPKVKILIGYMILVVGQMKFGLNQFKQLALQYYLHMDKVGKLKELVCCYSKRNKIDNDKTQLNRRQQIYEYQ